MKPTPPEICPNCGALVPSNAKACPGCGSDETSGWSDDATADRLGIPSEDFDYDKFVQEEFVPRSKPRRPHWIWWLTAALLAGWLLYLWLRWKK